MQSDIIKFDIFEDSPATILARVVALDDGDPIQQADLTSITCAIFDTLDTETVLSTPTLVVANVIFDTLQTSNSRWTEDTTGYNFDFTIPASSFPSGDRIYRAEFKFTDTGSSVTWVIAEIHTIPVFTS